MPRATTTRSVNLAQLGRELGGLGLVGRSIGTTTEVETVDGDVSQAALDAAVAAHVAIDTDANADTLRQRAENALAANAVYLGRPSPSSAQTTAQVQLLTRECSALIRLLLGLVEDVSGT